MCIDVFRLTNLFVLFNYLIFVLICCIIFIRGGVERMYRVLFFSPDSRNLRNMITTIMDLRPVADTAIATTNPRQRKYSQNKLLVQLTIFKFECCQNTPA